MIRIQKNEIINFIFFYFNIIHHGCFAYIEILDLEAFFLIFEADARLSEQKLFLISVHIFHDNRLSQFLCLKFSHTKTIQPHEQFKQMRKISVDLLLAIFIVTIENLCNKTK
jgi:hypothetical protein